MTDLYAILGVSPEATQDEIREAYFRRIRFDSPEAASTGPHEAWELRQAYEVLSDPERRRSYDWSRTAASGLSLPHEEPEHEEEHLSWNPITRMTHRLPRGWRITVDWLVTIAGAIAIVLAIKAWVVNPYRIPSSSMEPTLHCARPASGCEARFSDRVLANRFIYHFRKPARGDIIVFETPPEAVDRCGAGGTFVKRLVALPGETWEERDGFVYIDGKKLVEPYVKSRDVGTTYPPRKIPPGRYFMMGDNRNQSCDSREWGPIPRENIIGEVFGVYWPPNRIGFR